MTAVISNYLYLMSTKCYLCLLPDINNLHIIQTSLPIFYIFEQCLVSSQTTKREKLCFRLDIVYHTVIQKTYHQLLFCLTWILKGKPHRRDSSFKNYVYYIISLSERKTSFFFSANIAQIFYHQCTYKIAYIFCSFLFLFLFSTNYT